MCQLSSKYTVLFLEQITIISYMVNKLIFPHCITHVFIYREGLELG